VLSVTPDDEVWRKEVFGPVIALVPIDGLESTGAGRRQFALPEPIPV
jgi:hypothetical protein